MATEEVDDSGLNSRLSALSTYLPNSLEKVIFEQSIAFRDYVKSEKLNGQVLNRKTGALSDSIVTGGLQINGNVISANISTDSPYAAVHEKGLTVTKRSKTGKTYTASYPQRSFMESSFNDRKDEIVAAIRESLKGLDNVK